MCVCECAEIVQQFSIMPKIIAAFLLLAVAVTLVIPAVRSGHNDVNNGDLAPITPNCNCQPLASCLRQLDFPIGSTYSAKLEAQRCGNTAHPVGTNVLVCCPTGTGSNRRFRRDNTRRRRQHAAQHWVWDSQPIEPTDRPALTNDQAGPDRSRYSAIDIDNDIDDNRWSNNVQSNPFIFEDPETELNCPPSISTDFQWPDTMDEAAEDAVAPVSVAMPPRTYLGGVHYRLQETLINGPTCGVSIGPRIIGGQNAGPEYFPWMARLAYRNRTTHLLSYRCAGSLISDQYVLTVAHCVTNLSHRIELVLVSLGELDTSRGTGNLCPDGLANCAKPHEYLIESIRHHSGYDTPKYANDIALIRLRRPAGMATYLSQTALCLPFGKYRKSAAAGLNHNVIIAGWKATSKDHRTLSSTLQWLRLPLTNTTSCAASYARFSYTSKKPIIISETDQLCVQGRRNVDVCGSGDSGGPLMNDAGIDGRYTLLGLVSFGPDQCGVSDFPGVYTRVAAYMDWILDQMTV